MDLSSLEGRGGRSVCDVVDIFGAAHVVQGATEVSNSDDVFGLGSFAVLGESRRVDCVCDACWLTFNIVLLNSGLSSGLGGSGLVPGVSDDSKARLFQSLPDCLFMLATTIVAPTGLSRRRSSVNRAVF